MKFIRFMSIAKVALMVSMLLSIASCSTTKRLGADDILYTGVKKIALTSPEGTKPAIYKMVLMQAGVLQLSIISTLLSFLSAQIALSDPCVLNNTFSH